MKYVESVMEHIEGFSELIILYAYKINDYFDAILSPLYFTDLLIAIWLLMGFSFFIYEQTGGHIVKYSQSRNPELYPDTDGVNPRSYIYFYYIVQEILIDLFYGSEGRLIGRIVPLITGILFIVFVFL